MKTRRLLILAALLLFCTSVSAHSGKTDSKGGHYDHSTGEYHYHHGHPAHQHPNGVCPYDFDDRTGQNSGASGGSGGESTRTPTPDPEPEPEPPAQKKPLAFLILGTIPVLIFGMFPMATLILGLFSAIFSAIRDLFSQRKQAKQQAEASRIAEEQRLQEAIAKSHERIRQKRLAREEEQRRQAEQARVEAEQQQRRQEELARAEEMYKQADLARWEAAHESQSDQEQLRQVEPPPTDAEQHVQPIALGPGLSEHQEQFLLKQAELRKRYERKSISRIAGVPLDYVMDEYGFPHLHSIQGPVANVAVVYITQRGKRYHRYLCPSVGYFREVTLSQALREGYTPCTHCRPTGEEPQWLKKYREIDALRKEYGIYMKP